jgi:NDP-sugar pyrophosphorylase family protein
MKAIIMAGGKGSRLYPYSAVLPKPLMPLGETPVLEVLLRKLRREGIDGAILAVNHMRHLIEAYFGDGSANGDLLTTLDVAQMIAAHRETKADATIGVYEREVKVEFGLIDVDATMRMTGYREKPSQHHLVSMGIYVLRTAAVREFVLPNRYLDMPNLVTQMMETGGTVMCHRQDCVWLDIGRPDDFSMAQQMIERTPEQFLPPAE